MNKLNPDWFYTNTPDFEYKKYVLLAYLQNVHKQFNETKLYPDLAELVSHYRNLLDFERIREEFKSSFPDRIKHIHWEQFRIEFQKIVSDDDIMQYLDEIVSYAIPEIKKHLDEGKEIYEFVEKEIDMYPVGILPIYKDEGYMLINEDGSGIKVYEYAVKLFNHAHDQLRSIETQYITTYHHSFINTNDNIKIDMIRTRKKLPNPATYAVETKFSYPLKETVLPIAKRLLAKMITT